MKTLSVLDSVVVGDATFVRLPRPLVPLFSHPTLLLVSLVLLALSAFKGEVLPSPKVNPFDGLSE